MDLNNYNINVTTAVTTVKDPSVWNASNTPGEMERRVDVTSIYCFMIILNIC